MATKSKAEAPPVHIAEETVPAKINRSGEIRKEAKRLDSGTGEKPRPKDIVANLRIRANEVAPAQISGELKQMGLKPVPEKPSPRFPPKAPSLHVRPSPLTSKGITSMSMLRLPTTLKRHIRLS